MKKILLTYTFLCWGIVTNAIDFTKINTSYWYDLTANITLNHRVVSGNSGEVIVFFELKNRKGGQYQVNFLLQDSFEDPTHLIVEQHSLDTLLKNGMQQIFQLKFRPRSKRLLVISIGDRSSAYYFPIPLTRGGLDFPSFYPAFKGLPITQDFVKVDSVELISMDDRDSFYAFHYAKSFPPADPPMGIVQNVNPTLSPDTLLETDAVFENLLDYSFYFIQTDTNSNTGLTLYKAPDYYPVYRSVEETLPTLTYFSKPSELNQIINSADKKIAFDDFWLSLYPAHSAARAAIKGYYLKVFAANLLFTDYKEGWKTDRGILYSIFGKPSEVYRSNFEEVWVYNELRFEFRIISNLFAPSFYILKRDDKYQEEWFRKMKAIRGGN